MCEVIGKEVMWLSQCGYGGGQHLVRPVYGIIVGTRNIVHSNSKMATVYDSYRAVVVVVNLEYLNSGQISLLHVIY